jgi:hypothetical protein
MAMITLVVKDGNEFERKVKSEHINKRDLARDSSLCRAAVILALVDLAFVVLFVRWVWSW